MYKIITPVVTVFDKDEKPDYEGNKKVIDFLIKGGVDGILVLGSTGEFTHMDYETKRDFFKFYADYVDGRCELFAGTSDPDFKNIIKLSNDVHEFGYKGAMLIGPYYFGMDQEKIFVFYNTIAKEMKGDLYIYNFPARSGHSMEGSTLKKLLDENKNIKGLKDSVLDPLHTNTLMRNIEGYEFEMYSGFDDQYLYNISTGGAGSIGALSNLVPEIWADLVKASNEKDFDRSVKISKLIHKLMPLYAMDSNFALLFKRIMVNLGVDIDPRAIFPFNQIDEKKVEEATKLVKEVIEEYKSL